MSFDTALHRSLLCTAVFLILLSLVYASEVSVNLQLQRPLYDVSEKFVSFAIKPESLFRTIDGPSRISLTRMANMLGDSYIKFVGDFYFPLHNEFTNLRNSVQVIWNGFNRWTRAVNWTMIIPVPYSPDSWEPMQALQILNASYDIGITDCIWQLGTDFSSSRAQDYVKELRTFNVMVESFRPFVADWRIMGADVSAGSSAEETRRYVEMSKNLNAAFGWTQPALLTPSNRMSAYIYDNDPALKVLLSREVPVWLSLPAKGAQFPLQSVQENFMPAENDVDGDATDDTDDTEANHAFRWATTLGEAASLGFDAVFKPVSAADMAQPSFSFYVSVLFKKVMGSRVFPPRSLHVFAKTSKLYTHCANDVSGGLALMLINSDERVVRISVRSALKLRASELWQYTLQQQQQKRRRGEIWLNDKRLTLNAADLMPRVKFLGRGNGSNEPLNLNAPAMSVNFWVFPTAELEHCQFIAIEAAVAKLSSEDDEKVMQKRYSSSDRLLKKLIQETASTARRDVPKASGKPASEHRHGTLAAWNNLLEESWKKLFQPAVTTEKPKLQPQPQLKPLHKRSKGTRRQHSLHEATLGWLEKLLAPAGLPLLRRGARGTGDSYFQALFGAPAQSGRRKAVITRKITEIRKPEKKTTKPNFLTGAFDEEEYFRQMDELQEPEYNRFPEGDVHLTRITNVEDGEDSEETTAAAAAAAEKVKEESAEFISDRPGHQVSPDQGLWSLEYDDGDGGLALGMLTAKPETPRREDSNFGDNHFQPIQFAPALNRGKRPDVQQRQEAARGNSNTRQSPFVQLSNSEQDFFRKQHDLGHSFLSDVMHSEGNVWEGGQLAEGPKPDPFHSIQDHFNTVRQKRSTGTAGAEALSRLPEDDDWRQNIISTQTEFEENDQIDFQFNPDRMEKAKATAEEDKSATKKAEASSSFSRALFNKAQENMTKLMEAIKHNFSKWHNIFIKYFHQTPDAFSHERHNNKKDKEK